MKRFIHFIRYIASTMVWDVLPVETVGICNHCLNYTNESPLDELPMAGLSPDYVRRETQRA